MSNSPDMGVRYRRGRKPALTAPTTVQNQRSGFPVLMMT